MNKPRLSVILPAYNCGPYLALTLESIFAQSYTDFELIIINDGSSDNTEDIVKSFPDERIVYLKNDQNSGIVFTLNRGIDQARGEFIARMDGDDLCTPDRFLHQVQFFDKHPEAQILAGTIELINDKNEFIGYWDEERQVTSPASIRRRLIRENCIAHPTIMAKTDLFRKYKYTERQKNTEDYDLWLRLAADDVPFYKLSETVLRHRFFTQSVTRKDRKNIYYKNARAKFEFVKGRRKSGGVNNFTRRVYFSACMDLVRGVLKKIRNKFR